MRALLRLTAVLASVILLLMSAAGCAASRSEGFAIYLTRDDIQPARMEALSHVDIAAQPLISMKDIISYNAQAHELKVTRDAYERVRDLEVPVSGKSFVACVDKQPVYWGAFWTPLSSLYFTGVTIWHPFELHEPYILTLELGYPSADFYAGEDPRNSQAILDSLEKAGKLVTGLTAASINKLPAAMKGYELYSWEEAGRWSFCLITGTNRDKAPEELLYFEDSISEAGWVQLRVSGVEAACEVLSRLEPGQEVLWMPAPRGGEVPDGIDFKLPSEDMLHALKACAEQQGLKLSVP